MYASTVDGVNMQCEGDAFLVHECSMIALSYKYLIQCCYAPYDISFMYFVQTYVHVPVGLDLAAVTWQIVGLFRNHVRNITN